MSTLTRLFLIFGTASTLYYVTSRYRKSSSKISYTLFWIIFALILFISSLFPDLLVAVSDFVGIASPVNLVFLLINFVLLGKVFLLSLELEEQTKRLDEFVLRNAEKELEKELEKEKSDTK